MPSIARIAENERSYFIFSSSCTVYGAETMPINEDASIQTAMSPWKYPNREEIITDVAKVSI
jgi:UDP-glucose 4-epimerase